MTFYDILWHMTHDINCHKVWQYGNKRTVLIRLIDQEALKSFAKKQNKTKNAKYWNDNVSFVFLSRFLCKQKIAFLQP